MAVAPILFMGSPAFAVPSLTLLHKAGFDIQRVYTQPPRPAGRGQRLQRTDVHTQALALGIPEERIYTPARLRGEVLDELLAHPVNLVVVVAYGLLLPKALTDAKVCLNVHPSALPRWRGAAPLQHTLLAGDENTEICIMQLDEGMDTGPVYSRTPQPVPPDMTYGQLHDLTAALGAEELVKVLRGLPGLSPVAQVGEATLAHKIGPTDRVLDFTLPAEELHNRVRALSPKPGATWQLSPELGGEVLKVIKTAVGEPVQAGEAATPGTVLEGRINPRRNAVPVVAGNGTVLELWGLQRPGREQGPALEVWRGLQPSAQ